MCRILSASTAANPGLAKESRRHRYEIFSASPWLPDLRIGFASYWTLGEKTLRETRESPLGGVGHACEMETSMLLHLQPESVDMSKARTGGPFGTKSRYKLLDAQYGPPVYFVEEFNELSEHGGIGQPEIASKQKGQQF